MVKVWCRSCPVIHLGGTRPLVVWRGTGCHFPVLLRLAPSIVGPGALSGSTLRFPAGEHDQFPALARSSSALMFHATRKVSSTQAPLSSLGSRRTIDCRRPTVGASWSGRSSTWASEARRRSAASPRGPKALASSESRCGSAQGCTGGKSLRQPLDTSHEVDPKGAFEQCPVQRGPPRAPDRLGFEVDGLGSLDHDPERTAADGRDADLRSASDGDRTDRVAEQSEVGEGAQVGDAMLPVAESGSDSEVEVVGGGRGVERTRGRMA